MADVNNKIRLQIVTQLDAAGIKATKDQIDNLELGLRRSGTASGEASQKFGQLEKALGKLPGKLGEIGSKFGGLAGQAVMVAGAFSTGVEIGNKIVSLMRQWGLMSDTVEEFKKQTRAYNRELESLKNALSLVVSEEMKRMDLAVNSSEKQIKAIDDTTAAYFRQSTALKGLREAQGNAESLQLERAKFEDMRAYSEAGYTDAAEQIGRYYDVLLAESAAKQKIAAFDRESRDLDANRLQSEQALAKASERAAAAKQKQAEAEQNLALFRQKNGISGAPMYQNEQDSATDDALEKIADRARRDAEKADEIVRKRAERLDTVDQDILTRQMKRANLSAAETLAVDRAALAYDSYVLQAGNPLNVDIDQNWSSDLLKSSQDAYQVQRDLLSVCQEFGDRLEKLLELK